jgi:hypothetical protein
MDEQPTIGAAVRAALGAAPLGAMKFRELGKDEPPFPESIYRERP